MARYIKCSDALAICRKWNRNCFESNDSKGQRCAETIEDEILDLPTADVVEVVRCEKCKHGDVSTFSLSIDGEEEIACYCNLKKKTTDLDGYCPNGERKDA